MLAKLQSLEVFSNRSDAWCASPHSAYGQDMDYIPLYGLQFLAIRSADTTLADGQRIKEKYVGVVRLISCGNTSFGVRSRGNLPGSECFPRLSP